MLECMTDKYLIDNLKRLKTISPDKEWQKNAKSLFMAQINNSGAKSLSSSENFSVLFKSLFTLSFKPLAMTIGFFMLMITTSVFAHQAFENSKPDDSLYIARIISEKAKLSTVLDSKSRERLATKFAASHAEEISFMLADPNFDLEANEKKVAKLSSDFNREIDSVRSNINTWSNIEKEEKEREELIELATTSNEELKSEDEAIISIADNNKEDNGISVAINNSDDEEADEKPAEDLNVIEDIEKIKNEEDLKDPQLIDLVNDAQDLYLQGLSETDKDKLQEAGAKLQQVKEIINNQ